MKAGPTRPKRKSYYDFIFHEAERLTRLINNVLQLARMSRNEQEANLVVVTVDDALSELRPRLASQLEAATFELSIDCEDGVGEQRIRIDLDWFLQVFINLVDQCDQVLGQRRSQANRYPLPAAAQRSGSIFGARLRSRYCTGSNEEDLHAFLPQ